MFPEKEFHGLSPNFLIPVSVSDLYITTIGLPILLQENMWTDPTNYKSLTDTLNVEIGTEAPLPFVGAHKWDLRCSAVSANY
jgi:hypothetical protein